MGKRGHRGGRDFRKKKSRSDGGVRTDAWRQDKPGGECIFLEGRDCAVQPVKPQQCRDFPNGWNFPGFEKICRAVPREIP